MKKLIKNTHNVKVSLSLDGIILPHGEEALVNEQCVSELMVKKGLITFVKEVPSEKPSEDTVEKSVKKVSKKKTTKKKSAKKEN